VLWCSACPVAVFGVLLPAQLFIGAPGHYFDPRGADQERQRGEATRLRACAELAQWGRPWSCYRTPLGTGVRGSAPHKKLSPGLRAGADRRVISSRNWHPVSGVSCGCVRRCASTHDGRLLEKEKQDRLLATSLLQAQWS
jgi:hypothetical protein